MGVAEFLAKNKSNLKGKVVFIFQPAEEGPPEGGGGAEMMLAEGSLIDINRKISTVKHLMAFFQ